MRHKKGEYGNINLTGEKWGPAYLLSCKSENFLDEIEEGIKPVVKACMDVGLDTYSSCEGHHYPDGSSDTRYIDIVIEKNDEARWNEYIDSLTNKYGIKLSTKTLEITVTEVLNKVYNDPERFKIYFLATNRKKLDFDTNLLAKSILNKEFTLIANKVNNK